MMRLSRRSNLIRWLCYAQALVLLVIGLPWSPVTLRPYSSYADLFTVQAEAGNDFICHWESSSGHDQARSTIILDELPGRKALIIPGAQLYIPPTPFLLPPPVLLSVVIDDSQRIENAVSGERDLFPPRAPPVFSS